MRGCARLRRLEIYRRCQSSWNSDGIVHGNPTHVEQTFTFARRPRPTPPGATHSAGGFYYGTPASAGGATCVCVIALPERT
jgi:hypothetical protein